MSTAEPPPVVDAMSPDGSKTMRRDTRRALAGEPLPAALAEGDGEGDASLTGASLALMQKLKTRTAVIGVIGLGYVGLPACIGIVGAGMRCFGFDIDSSKIASLTAGRSYLRHIGLDELTEAGRRKDFVATDDFSRLTECDALLITVPTPLDGHQQPDLSFVVQTCRTVSEHLRPGMLVVLESTSYPGTTTEVMIPILEGSGLKAGSDFYAGFSPEREDPGNSEFPVGAIPKVVAGSGPVAGRLVEALYRATHATVVVASSPEVAEASKLLENIFRSVNIALVNELKLLFMKMNIDIWEVIEAARTKPFGFMPFYPGPGLGGHCIPIDPFYLSWKAREYGQPTRFIELAGEINRMMPGVVIAGAAHALNEHSRSVRGARILLLGLAYKPDIDDDRESPSYPVMRMLAEMGADVSFNDPFVSVVPPKREYPEFEGLCSSPVSADYDLLILMTAHSEYRSIEYGCLGVPIVDTRNVVPRDIPGVFRC